MVLKDIQIKIDEINKSIPNINYGGCGTFSYHLKKVLDKYSIESEIYYLPGEPSAIEYDVLFTHIVLKVEDYIIDNNGFYNFNTGWCKDLKLLPDDKLEEMLSIPGLWNTLFYNEDNIDKLVNKIIAI